MDNSGERDQTALALYDEDLKKRFIIDHEQLQFDKNDGWTLIGIPEKEEGTLSDHEYFLFMMIYLIEFNQLIKIEISYWGYIK